MFAWIAICTGIAIIPSQLILGIVLFYNPGFDAQPWHYFILYQVINVLVLFYCTALLKKSLWIHDACCKHPRARTSAVSNSLVFITLASFFVIVIVCLARTAPNFQPNVHVWAKFLNDSGWTSGGVAFLTGLVSPNYMYAGIDGALHLAEECKDAARVVPRALLSTLVIGFGTSFAFLVTMLYCTDDLKAVVASATGSVTPPTSPVSNANRVQGPYIRSLVSSHSLKSSSNHFHNPPQPSSRFRPNRRPGDRRPVNLVPGAGQHALRQQPNKKDAPEPRCPRLGPCFQFLCYVHHRLYLFRVIIRVQRLHCHRSGPAARLLRHSRRLTTVASPREHLAPCKPALSTPRPGGLDCKFCDCRLCAFSLGLL